MNRILSSPAPRIPTLPARLRYLTVAVLASGVAAVHAAEPTEVTLQHLTQALLDAVAPGERTLWARYTDPTLIYVSEDNEVKGRGQVLADLKPLPTGSSGWIVVQDFRCNDLGAVAVTTYVMDEHESVEGHPLHARYRGSDTWRRTREGWRLVAEQVYAIPLDPTPASVPPGRLEEYVGRYTLAPGTQQSIRRDGDHLVAERPGRPAQQLLRESGDVFFTPGRPRTRRIFTRDADGRVSGFADRREGSDLPWTRDAPGS